MSRVVRSSRGEFVDFELLAIKAQLAATPAPKNVEERKLAIEEKEGLKPQLSPSVNELLAVANEAAATSAKASPKKK